MKRRYYDQGKIKFLFKLAREYVAKNKDVYTDGWRSAWPHIIKDALESTRKSPLVYDALKEMGIISKNAHGMYLTPSFKAIVDHAEAERERRHTMREEGRRQHELVEMFDRIKTQAFVFERQFPLCLNLDWLAEKKERNSEHFVDAIRLAFTLPVSWDIFIRMGHEELKNGPGIRAVKDKQTTKKGVKSPLRFTFHADLHPFWYRLVHAKNLAVVDNCLIMAAEPMNVTCWAQGGFLVKYAKKKRGWKFEICNGVVLRNERFTVLAEDFTQARAKLKKCEQNADKRQEAVA